MILSIGKCRCRIDAVFLLLPLLVRRFGMNREALALLLSLAAHESGHLIAAKIARANVSELRFTPFGALATIEKLYELSPGRVAAVAAAGPAANLAAILLLCAACQMNWLSPENAAIGLRVNLLLLLFNLLPALPLDGGRIAWALLSGRLSRKNALTTLTASGIAVAAGLIALAVGGWIRFGQLNLSLAFTAIFLIATLPRERETLAGGAVQAILARMQPLAAPQPAQLYLIDATTPKSALLRTLRAGRASLYLRRDTGRLITDRALLRQLAREEGR